MPTMISIDTYKFGIDSLQYQKLQRTAGYRWAAMNRIGCQPARQFKGVDSVSMTLDILHFPENANDLMQFERLQDIAQQGKAVRLISGSIRRRDGHVSGSGLDLGLWVIEKVDTQEENFSENGVPLQISGSITLTEYGEDVV